MNATDLSTALDEAYARGRAETGQGSVATYIPELATADPERFGLAVATIDGETFTRGDAEVPFTFQSVSKVFALSHVLATEGRAVLERMSCEPSGDAFHSIVKLEEEQGRPRNPYINAGAILVSSRMPGETAVEKSRGLRAFLSGICDGSDFPVDERVYASESATGFRNRALANFMRHYGQLADPEMAVEAYFRQCSISLDAARLARLGLFLANGGVDPATGRRVLATEDTRMIVALMATCGLYDEVGHFAINVGLPAKSGVSGAILAIVPGRMSVVAYGPALGAKGNSVAGLAALKSLSRSLDLSVFG